MGILRNEKGGSAAFEGVLQSRKELLGFDTFILRYKLHILAKRPRCGGKVLSAPRFLERRLGLGARRGFLPAVRSGRTLPGGPPGQHHTAFPTRNDLVGIETENAYISKAPAFAALIFCTVGLGRIVRRDALDSVRVADGDRLELVHFVGGG